MAYCWLRKRGKTFHLVYARSLGLGEESLRTSDRKLAEEVQRRRESELFCNAQGIKRNSGSKITLSEMVAEFIRSKRAEGLADKTLTNYIRVFNHLGDYLKQDIRVSTITTKQLEDFIISRRESHQRWGEGTMAPKTIRNEVFAVIGLFKWAASRDLITEDPTQKLSKPKRVKYDDPRYLTFNEYLRLKEVIKSEVFSDIVDFYLLTGIRRSDGLKVTSENFDFELGTAKFLEHKQGTTRKLPITDDLRAVVDRMIARVGKGQPLIQLHESRLTGNFAAARERAGLPESITFHSLRHTFASWLAHAGVDFVMLQSLIGHQSQESTQVYLHAFNENKATALQRLKLPRKAG
jgi:integrase